MGLFGLTLDVSAEFASRFLTVTEENNLDAKSKFTAALDLFQVRQPLAA